jgi:hypothetical protein
MEKIWNKDVFRFNKNIYPLESIKNSIELFSSSMDYVINEIDDYYEIKILIKDNPVNEIINEFCNYILYDTIVSETGD